MYEKTLKKETVFKGKIFDLERHEILNDKGINSIRDIVQHPGAVAILARTSNEKFVMVRQFRKAVNSEMLEVVAGTLESGEDVEVCAHRELLEEIGCTTQKLIPLGNICPSPAILSEHIHLFYAEVDENQKNQKLDEDENLVRVELDEDEIEAYILTGKIKDSKTIATWYLYKLLKI